MRLADRTPQFNAAGYLIGHANGIRVLVSPDPATNLVEVDLRIRAGSRDDGAGRAGLAHLVEHSVYELAPGGGPTIGQSMDVLTLEYNAATDHDVTHLRATITPAALPRLFELYAEILRGDCTSLTPAAFEREREVVRNELRQRQDRDDAAPLDAVLFPPAHPYHHGVIGTLSSLDAITQAEVCAFYAGRFTPENAVMVVAGAVQLAQVQALSDRVLRSLPTRPVPPRTKVTPWFGGGARHRVSIAGASNSVALAFPFPPRFHGDELAARQLLVALTIKLATLAEKVPQITDTRVGLVGGREAPVLLALVELSDPKIAEKAEQTLWQAVDETRELAENPFFHQLVSQIMRHQVIRAVEPLATRGTLYADYFDAPEGYGFFAGEVAGIDGLTPELVGSTYLRVFSKASAAMLTIVPGPRRTGAHMPSFTALPDSHTGADDRLAAVEVPAPVSPAIERYVLSNGLTVILAPIAAMPVVDIRLVIGAGHRDVPPEKPHLAMLTANLRSLDTDTANVDQAYMTLSGARVEVEVDDRATTFSTAGLGVYVDFLLEGLSANVIRVSHASGDVWRFKKALTRSRDREKQRAQQDQQTAGHFVQALFGADPRCNPAQRIDELVATRYHGVELAGFKRKHYRAANATLIVTGNFVREIAVQHIAASFGPAAVSPMYSSWNRPREPAPSFAATGMPGGPRPRHVASVDNARTQLELALGYLLPAEVQGDLAAASLLRELVDAEVASIRARLGASYGFRTALVEACGNSVLLVVGDVDPARAAEVQAALRRGLEHLRVGEGLEGRLKRARSAALRRLHAELGDSRAIADRLQDLAARQLPDNAFAILAARVRQLGAAELGPKLAAALAGPVTMCRGPGDAVRRVCGPATPVP